MTKNKQNLPDGWQWVKLGDVCELKNGINFSTQQKGSGILTFDVLNMYPEGVILDCKELYRVNINLKKDYLLQPKDILFVRSSVKQEGIAWASLFNGYTEPVTFCGFLIRARIINPIVFADYLVYYCRLGTVRDFLIFKSTKGTITNINQENLKECEKLKQALQEQLDTINQLPSALLRRAFNGEL